MRSMIDKTTYVGGPMSGYPKLNFPMFFYVENALINAGATTMNPARKDVEAGLDWETQDGTLAQLEAVNFDMREAITWDLLAIINECDSLVLLPGWKKSKGAKAEYALARFLNLDIYEWHDNDVYPITKKVYLDV